MDPIAALSRLKIRSVKLPTEESFLRWVKLPGGYSLFLWDTGRRTGGAFGRCDLGYVLRKGRRVIFEGDRYSPGAGTAIDSDAAVFGLLGFLTLKPGDTDPDYFRDYTPGQLEWASSDDAERLAMLAYDYENREQLAKEHADFRAPRLRDVVAH